MSSTRESTELRRRQIVDAARRIIATRGTDALTIREIAKEVGISDGDVYRHFENKRDIILLLIEDIERTLLKAVKRAAHEKNKPLASLSNVLKAHLSYVEQRRGISLIIISETVRSADSDLRQRMFKVVDQYICRIEELLAHGVELGQVRKDLDINTAAFTFFALVHGTVTLWALSDSAFSLAQRHKPLWDSYLASIAVRGD
jgi:AcrR family transcriptional regulator